MYMALMRTAFRRAAFRRKAAAFFLILLLGLPSLLAAQENDPEVEPDWDVYSSDLYAKGDFVFVISIGVSFPTLFLNNGSLISDHKFSPAIGGRGALAVHYYLSPHFFIGGELEGMFVPTVGGNTLFVIPLGVRAGTQIIAGRFEFPFYVTVGGSWHNYLNYGHYGLYVKGSASAYFRPTSEWSFGLVAGWAWYPERTKIPAHDIDGNFIDLMLSARYHF